MPSSSACTIHETPVALLPELLSCLECCVPALAGSCPAAPESHPLPWPVPHVLPRNNVRGSVAVPQCVRVPAHPWACALVGTPPESLWPTRGWLCTGQSTCVQPPARAPVHVCWGLCVWVHLCAHLGRLAMCQCPFVCLCVCVSTAVPELTSQPSHCKPRRDFPAQQCQPLAHTQPRVIGRDLERPTALTAHRGQSQSQAIPLMLPPGSLGTLRSFPGSLLLPHGETWRLPGSGGSVGMGESCGHRGLCPEPGAMGEGCCQRARGMWRKEFDHVWEVEARRWKICSSRTPRRGKSGSCQHDVRRILALFSCLVEPVKPLSPACLDRRWAEGLL